MTTFATLVDDVHDELRNYAYPGYAVQTGDGVKTIYTLPDQNIVAGLSAVTVAAVAYTEVTTAPGATEYVIDDDIGKLTFGVAPTLGAEIICYYESRRFSEEMVQKAINLAIHSAYPEFHVYGYDTHLTGVVDTQDYVLPPNIETVTRVEVYNTSWGINRDWEVKNRPAYSVTAHTSDYLDATDSTTLVLASGHGYDVDVGDVLLDGTEAIYVSAVSSDTLTVTRGYADTTAATHSAAASWELWSDKYLHFHKIPYAGAFRITYVGRGAALSSDSDTLESTSGLPTRARAYLVSYAVWSLLKSAEAQRVFDDRAHNSQGTGGTRVYELTNTAQSWQAKWQYEKSVNRMRPWGRG